MHRSILAFEGKPRMKSLFIVLLIAITPAWSAEKPESKTKATKKPRRAVRVVVVKPYFDPKWEAGNLAANVIGNLVGQWMARPRQRTEWDWNINDPGPSQEAEYIPTPRVPIPEQIATYTIESSEPRSEVLIDAKSVGLTPVTMVLTSGVRFIVVRRKGFETWTREVESRPGDSIAVQADLKPIEVTPDVIVVKLSAPRQ